MGLRRPGNPKHDRIATGGGGPARGQLPTVVLGAGQRTVTITTLLFATPMNTDEGERTVVPSTG